MADYAVVPNIIDTTLKPEDNIQELEEVVQKSEPVGVSPVMTGVRIFFLVCIVVSVLLLVYVIYQYVKNKFTTAPSTTPTLVDIPNKPISKEQIDLEELKKAREAAQKRKNQKKQVSIQATEPVAEQVPITKSVVEPVVEPVVEQASIKFEQVQVDEQERQQYLEQQRLAYEQQQRQQYEYQLHQQQMREQQLYEEQMRNRVEIIEDDSLIDIPNSPDNLVVDDQTTNNSIIDDQVVKDAQDVKQEIVDVLIDTVVDDRINNHNQTDQELKTDDLLTGDDQADKHTNLNNDVDELLSSI